jgi:hypothetical protein
MSHFTSSPEAVGMLVVVWGLVLTNMLYCFYRILTSKRHLGGGDEEST